MKKLKDSFSYLDVRPICDFEVLYKKVEGSWYVEVNTFPANREDGYARRWLVTGGAVTAAQLEDITTYLARGANSAVYDFLPIKGLAPGI